MFFFNSSTNSTQVRSEVVPLLAPMPYWCQHSLPSPFSGIPTGPEVTHPGTGLANFIRRYGSGRR